MNESERDEMNELHLALARSQARVLEMTAELQRREDELVPLRQLQANLEALKGGDPFIEIEGELILFTEIRTIRPDEKGGIHVGPMNGRERWTSAMSARALADLVSAHYRRQAQPPPAQE